MDNETIDHQAQRRSRWQLVLLMVLFATPIVASYVMYFTGWLPEARSNKGELIDPVRPIPDFSAPTWAGGRFDLASLDAKWVMLAIADGECGEGCRNNLYTLRQVRKALAKGQYAVERVILFVGAEPPANAAGLMQEFEGTHFLLADDTVKSRWLDSFKNNEPLDGQRFLIDPMGNLMMRYRPDQDPKDMLEDLDHLLAASGFH